MEFFGSRASATISSIGSIGKTVRCSENKPSTKQSHT